MKSDSNSHSQDLEFINDLVELIHQRKLQAEQSGAETNSYTISLFKKGINKVAQKVGEEAVELVIEAMDHNPELFKNEAADLIFHLLVLLEAKNVPLHEVIKILKDRHKQ